MRRLALFLTVLAACSVLAAEKCDIGGKLHSLPSPEWMDGTFRKVADIRGNKKFAVLYIWRPDQAALTDFPRITAVTEKFRKQVAFAGIAIAGKERIKRFPGALRLGFPINADNKNAIADAVALPSKSPVALVLDSQNTLLWSGATAALPMILQECLDGKFDLKEEIRKNQFTNAVNKAVREQKFAEAYQLLNGEWKKTCDSLELLNAQVLLLTRKLNRADDAFALLHEAQRKNPGKHLFFEAEYRLLGHPAHAKRVPDFFVRVKQSFRDQPGVLMAFAMAEMGRPAESLDLPLVLSLVLSLMLPLVFSDGLLISRPACHPERLACHLYLRPLMLLQFMKSRVFVDGTGVRARYSICFGFFGCVFSWSERDPVPNSFGCLFCSGQKCADKFFNHVCNCMKMRALAFKKFGLKCCEILKILFAFQ